MKDKYDNISVTAFILWQGEALLVQRVEDEDFLANYWEQVGGKVEPGETKEQAVVREVKEETGVDVKPLRSYHQCEYTHPDGRLVCEVAYICKVTHEPKVVLSSEHQQYRWVAEQELGSITPLTDNMREVVRKGFNYLKK